MKRNELIRLKEKLLTPEENKELKELLGRREIQYVDILEFDKKIGGVGIHNIDDGSNGRYDVRDRDIFRPIQYIKMYLEHQTLWLTRGIVQMCGLHLESVLKRITHQDRFPLGQAVSNFIAVRKLGNEITYDLKTIVALYNNAKHKVDHPKDTHLFSIEDALNCYIVTRKLSNRILPLVKIYTQNSVWL